MLVLQPDNTSFVAQHNAAAVTWRVVPETIRTNKHAHSSKCVELKQDNPLAVLADHKRLRSGAADIQHRSQSPLSTLPV